MSGCREQRFGAAEHGRCVAEAERVMLNRTETSTSVLLRTTDVKLRVSRAVDTDTTCVIQSDKE